MARKRNLEKQRIYWRRWYAVAVNKADQIARVAKNKRRRLAINKKFVLGLKLKCTICPESDPACLDFHHKDPKQKDMAVASMLWNCSVARIQKEIDKCIVLCANCHRKLHAKECNGESSNT